MKCRTQVLFDMVATALHPSVMRSIIAYMERSMIPICYKKPELLPEEINRVLNNMASGYQVVNSFPVKLDEQQLYVDLQMEKSDEMGVVYLYGRFRVFVTQKDEPVIEDVFNIIVSPGLQLEALNRQLYLYGEIIASKFYPPGKKPTAASRHSNSASVSLVNA